MILRSPHVKILTTKSKLDMDNFKLPKNQPPSSPDKSDSVYSSKMYSSSIYDRPINDRYGKGNPKANIVKDDERPIKPATQMYNSDENPIPIRSPKNERIIGLGAETNFSSKYQSTKWVDVKKLGGNDLNTSKMSSVIGMSLNDSETSGQRTYLRKRSKMVYDPMKAAREASLKGKVGCCYTYTALSLCFHFRKNQWNQTNECQLLKWKYSMSHPK